MMNKIKLLELKLRSKSMLIFFVVMLLSATQVMSEEGPKGAEEVAGGEKEVATAENVENDPAKEEVSTDAGVMDTTAEQVGASSVEPTLAEEEVAEKEYELRVKELETRINDLKEQVHRSKAKLTLLAEAVTAGSLGRGAQVVIIHKNEMGNSFLLNSVNYFLDGGPLWQEVDLDGHRLSEKKKYVVWEGNIVEGSHTLSVNMNYKGDGSGLFKYLDGYSFKLKDSITFTAEPGRQIVIEVVGFEKGNFTTELMERPSIRFDTQIDNTGSAKEAE